MKFNFAQKLFLLSLFAFSSLCFAQKKTKSFFKLNSLELKIPVQGSYDISLDTLWKVAEFPKLDSSCLSPDFDDSKWEEQTVNIITKSLKGTEGVFCCRLHVVMDSSLRHKTAAFVLMQFGASQIYVDGKKICEFGRPGINERSEERFNPNKLPFVFDLPAKDTFLIAVIFSNHGSDKNLTAVNRDVQGFLLSLGDANSSIANYSGGLSGMTFYVTFLACLFLTLGFVHLMMFLFHRKKMSNFYYAVFAFCIGIMFVMVVNMFQSNDPDVSTNYYFWSGLIWSIIPVTLLALLYNLFYGRYPLIFKIFFASYFVVVLTVFFGLKWGVYLAVLNAVVTCIEFLRIVIWSIIKKKDGAWIIGSGLLGFIFLFVGLFFFVMLYYKGFQHVNWTSRAGVTIGMLYLVGVLAIPLSMSVYLARDFAVTSKNLAKKLKEVEELSAKTIEQEKEKQKYLETQKETLEQQVMERTAELTKQKNLIEEKQKEILDSIHYAKRIQTALLMSEKNMERVLNKLNKG